MSEGRGIVQNGQIVMETGFSLPEGTVVFVRPAATPAAPPPSSPSLGEKLAALGRAMDGRPCNLPSDLAANHDHYLHGLRKRA